MPAKKKAAPKKKAAAPRGRPTKKTEAVISRLCKEIASGRSLRSICAASDMPSADCINRWLREDDDFYLRYARAREDQADYYADSVHEIAQNEEDVQRARLRVDAIKWHASKLAPGRYSERAHQILEGSRDNPVQVEIKSDLDIARRLGFLLSKASDDAS